MWKVTSPWHKNRSLSVQRSFHCPFFTVLFHIRVMRDAWSVMRDACSPKSLKIEGATPHARHTWCVFVFWLAYSPLSREPTMTSFDGCSRVPPKILACDPGFQGQKRADPFVDNKVLFSYLFSFLVTVITLLCHATWLMIRIWGSWSIWLRNTQHCDTSLE